MVKNVLGLSAVLLVGILLRFVNVSTVGQRSPDERSYTIRAIEAVHYGLRATRRDAREYLTDPARWSTPVPTRVGYTGLLVLAMKFSGAEDMRAGSYLACLASILSLGVAVLLGFRQFGSGATLLGLLFLDVFPPELAIARRCWQDAVVGLAGVVLLLLATEAIRRGPRVLPLVAFVLWGSFCLLIKETLLFLYVPCFLVLLWRLRLRREKLVLLSAGAAGASIAYSVLAFFMGGWEMPVDLLRAASNAAGSVPYAIATSSGPGNLLPAALHGLAPMTANLAAIGFLLAITRFVAIVPAGFLLIFMIVPHWLNLRFVSPIFAPLCLLAGYGLWNLFLLGRRKLQWPLFVVVSAAIGVVLLVSLAADLRRFREVFVRQGANDLAVGVLFRAMASEDPVPLDQKIGGKK